jgi:hypothetical protein
MKAALAGAAAAAMWQAPRIQGLSVAPDVAQAASCTSVGPAALGGSPHAAVVAGGDQCWGGRSGGICQTFTFLSPLALQPFAVGVVIAGDDAGTAFTGFGFGNVNVSGIDPPWNFCTVTLQANCTLGAPSTTITRIVRANGQTALSNVPSTNLCTPTSTVASGCQFSCNEIGAVPANVTVNVSCTCP